MNSHRGTKGDGSADRPRAHCGVGAVADVKGRASHEVIQDALHVLERLDHRGARGAEENTGDGAGILVQKPDRLPPFYWRQMLGGREPDIRHRPLNPARA